MKKFLKLGLATLILATGIVAAFAFKPVSATKALPRYFRLNSAVAITANNLKNPANWTEVMSSQADHTTTFVHEIKILQNESTYIYASGTNVNRPKVDVAGQFQDDILLAGGFGSPAQVQEVFQSDYEMYANSTR